MKSVIVIGAGMGGLTAAIRLARQSLAVSVLEARESPGGLASSFQIEGFPFDAGPYILLDRPGLEWAFSEVGLDLATRVRLLPLDDIYQVDVGGQTVRFFASAERTAAEFDRTWPGSGARYLRYVESMGKTYRRLQPLLLRPHEGPAGLLRDGLWKESRFLLRSLGSILASTSLPQPVQEAIAIWTHVAGQPLREAPSPMAFVSALIHQAGCFYPAEGIGAIPQVLLETAQQAGVQFRFGARVRSIRTTSGRVCGVETDRGEFFEAGAVVSNHSGVGTYLNLLDSAPADARRRASSLPLQSPGVCAYLKIQGAPKPPYLRFLLPETERCRLLITPAAVDPTLCRDGWSPARLLGPMDFAEAETLGKQGQREYLDRLLGESWWRANVTDFRVLSTRVPAQWGVDFHLHRESMNPVMTAHFMREGRFAHRSPHVGGLYLTGSSTHPGQWVSFCAISGILAANCVIEDLPR